MPTGGRAPTPPSRRRDASRNHQAILAAARRLYAEQPSAPLYEVAHLAGLGQATLYRHFPDRPTLIGALATEALDDLMSRLLESTAPPLSTAQQLALVAQALAASPPLVETLRGELAPSTANPDDVSLRVVPRLRNALSRRSTREIGTPDPDLTTGEDVDIVLAMLCGAFDAAGADGLAREQIARRAVEILAGTVLVDAPV